MRIGRSSAIAALAATMLPCWGCGLAPHSFRKFQPSAGLTRARSVGADARTADAQVLPALVTRLEDEDPVVRLAANEELRKRTGKDFGFVAWASPEERSASIARWRAWLTAPPMPAEPIRTRNSATPPAAPTRVARGPARRRRVRPPFDPATTPASTATPAPSATTAPSTSERAPS